MANTDIATNPDSLGNPARSLAEREGNHAASDSFSPNRGSETLHYRLDQKHPASEAAKESAEALADDTARRISNIDRRLEEFQRVQESLHRQIVEQFQERETRYKNEIAAKETICEDLTERLTGCSMRLAELQNQLGIQKNLNYELQVEIDRWNAFQRGRGWQIMSAMYKFRLALLPRGGHGERVAKIAYKLIGKSLRPFKTAVRIAKNRLFTRNATPYSVENDHPTRKFVRAPALAETLEPVEVKGLVSVVLPVYNHAKLLKGAIESVLAQTYANFELIVVNDGSTDGVESVLAEYVDHPQVRILTQKNQKVSAALNNAFQFARGEFWTWTSADNLMMPDQLKKQVEFLQSHGEAGMVYSDYVIIDENGEPARDPTFRPHNRYSPADPEIHLPHSTELLCVVLDNFIGACFLYRAAAARLIGDYDGGLGVDDYDYWMRMNMAFKIAHIGTTEPLYQYRVHDNCLSAKASELGIYERVHKLMDYQRDRAVFFEKPWTIYADRATCELLKEAKIEPNRVVPWTGQAVEYDPDEKRMILVQAESLPSVVEAKPSAQVFVGAWFGADALAPYRYRQELRKLRAVCFSREDTTLERLGMVTDRRFRIGSADSLLSQMACYANNRTYMNSTRTREELNRVAPRPIPPAQRRMRILLQAENFTQGGLEQVVADLASSLDRAKFDPMMLVLGQQGRAVEQMRERGIRILTLPTKDRESAYRQLLLDERIDLVNSHFSIYGGYLAWQNGIPFVQTVHNSYIWLPSEEIAQYRENDTFTTAYLCVSPTVAQYTDIKLGLSPGKMIVVPNGIDLDRLESKSGEISREKLRADLGIAPDDFVFLNVASIAPVKAQCDLVQAFVRAMASCPQAKLVLLGKPLDKEYHEQLLRLIDELDLRGSVIPAGHHDHVASFYRACDAFVLPSYYEGWSLAMNEAVCANLPIIASDVGGAADLLSEVGGKLIPPPYGSIVNLTFDGFKRCSHTYDSEFIGRLAEAMEATYRERPRPCVTAEIRERLGARHTYRIYEQLFTWFVQGASAESARPWLVAGRQD